MATFALIHGGAGTAALWAFVSEHLVSFGHEAVAMDLPCDDPEAGWDDYVGAVEKAVEGRRSKGELTVVGHSLGGFVAPLRERPSTSGGRTPATSARSRRTGATRIPSTTASRES